jgi:hypothetical protein
MGYMGVCVFVCLCVVCVVVCVPTVSECFTASTPCESVLVLLPLLLLPLLLLPLLWCLCTCSVLLAFCAQVPATLSLSLPQLQLCPVAESLSTLSRCHADSTASSTWSSRDDGVWRMAYRVRLVVELLSCCVCVGFLFQELLDLRLVTVGATLITEQLLQLSRPATVLGS